MQGKYKTMKRLILLAKRIKDAKLQGMVLELLQENGHKLSNKEFPYKAEDPNTLPSSLSWHHPYEGGHIDHTYSVTLLSISAAESLKKAYGTEVNMDVLIAGALLHDIGKLWSWKKEKGEWTITDIKLDHTILGVAELYSRGFPEDVIHVVAAHAGEHGTTPPQTIEALIVQKMDLFDAELTTPSQEDILSYMMKGK